MPTAVRDASMVTKRNRDMAEFAAYTSWQKETMGSAKPNAAVRAPVVGGANSIAEVTTGGIATNAFNNEFVKNGGNASTIFGTLGYDSNVAFYPPNPSSGGAGRSF